MEVLLPEDFLKKFMERVSGDVQYLDDHYDSVYAILGDAMKGAMSWAPQAVMSKQVPPLKNIYSLAVQLLTICYCTERNTGKS